MGWSSKRDEIPLKQASLFNFMEYNYSWHTPRKNIYTILANLSVLSNLILIGSFSVLYLSLLYFTVQQKKTRNP